MKFLLKNWFVLTVGLVLTAVCVRMAYHERGYIAAGGEWLVIPLILVVKSLTRSVLEDIRHIISDYTKF